MTRLEAQARESFARDVKSVAGEFIRATTTDDLTASLAELVELATDCRALVSNEGNTLAIRLPNSVYRITVRRYASSSSLSG